jgi:hypothetical protein
MVPLKVVMNPLNEIIWLAIPILSLVSALACILFRRVSGWAFLLMAGFVLDGLVGLGMRAAWFLVSQEVLEFKQYDVLATVASFGHLTAALIIVAGVFATLAGAQNRLNQARSRDGRREPRDRGGYPDSEGREGWEPRERFGSQDIHE